MKFIGSPVRGLFAATLFLSLLAPLTLRAVSIDLTGAKIVQHGKITVTSTAALPAAVLYNVDISVTGTGTGTYAETLGSGDLGTVLANKFFQPNLLHATLANLPGNLPAKLASGHAFQNFFAVALSTGTANVVGGGVFLLKIDKNGILTASVRNISVIGYMGRKGTVFSGNYTALSGTMIVAPALVNSGSAQPDIMVMPNTHIVLGNDVYASGAPGTGLFAFLPRGHGKSQVFLVQNDGPATDSITVTAGSVPAGLSIQVFDGKTNVTSQVTGAGYTISNLAPGETRMLKMRTTVAKSATKNSFKIVTLEVASTTNPSAVDFASGEFIIK